MAGAGRNGTGGGMVLIADLPWLEGAACAGHEVPEMWFPFRDFYDDSKRRRAIEICGGCSVRTECLAYALPLIELDGIWGGLTADQRRDLRRKGKR